MSILSRLFNKGPDPREADPLYQAVVRLARDPAWYLDGQVPDTMQGRFDVLAALTALVLLRLEREGDAARQEAVLLTETFIADMEGTLRQIGIGDFVVGKRVGKLVGALGGRLGAFREASAFGPGVRHNVFHDSPPSEEAVAFVAGRMERFAAALAERDAAALWRGEVPSP